MVLLFGIILCVWEIIILDWRLILSDVLFVRNHVMCLDNYYFGLGIDSVSGLAVWNEIITLCLGALVASHDNHTIFLSSLANGA